MTCVRLPFLLAVLLAASACSEDAAVTLQGNSADAAAGTDVYVVANPPVLTNAAVPTGPYAHVSGQWQGDRNRLVVEVRVGGSVDVVGLAGQLTWDPAVLRLESTAVNDELLVDDPSIWSQRSLVKETPAGRLLLGSARFRTTSSPWLQVESFRITNAKWLTLTYEVLGKGDTAIAFDPTTTVVRNELGAQQKLTWTAVQVAVPADFVPAK
jgi:hypothetical protein